MATSRQRQTEVEPPAPQLAPPALAIAGSDYNVFIWQQLAEIQKSVAEMNSNLQHLKSSMDSTRGKVDDLISWKHKIIGGAIVFGVICTLLGFVITKVSSYPTFQAPSTSVEHFPSSKPATPLVK